MKNQGGTTSKKSTGKTVASGTKKRPPVPPKRTSNATPSTAKRVAKPVKKVEMEKPKSKKRKRRVVTIIVTFFSVGIIICGVYIMFTLPKFNTTQFSVEGTQKYSKEDVIGKSGLTLGKNVFLQLITGSKNQTANLPYIDTMQLTYEFPSTIGIHVSERVCRYFAFDKENNKFYRLSEEGYILEEADINTKTKDELLTYGITFDNEVKLGVTINEIDVSKLQVYEEIVKEYEKSGIKGTITKVNFENSLTTITLDDKLNVVLPNNTNLSYNLSFLKGIIEKLGEGAVGIIDMTKDNPTFSTF